MTEQQLILQLKSKDDRRFGFHQLVAQYQQKLYWLIRRMVVDHDDTNDVLQNVFLRVWENIDGFRGESGLYTWIYRIAVNETLLFLKKKKRKFFLPLHDVEAELEGKVEQLHVGGDEIEKKLMKAVLQLPGKQQMVFNLRYFQELSYADMSKILNTSEGALKASYHHAVKKIEKYIQIED